MHESQDVQEQLKSEQHRRQKDFLRDQVFLLKKRQQEDFTERYLSIIAQLTGSSLNQQNIQEAKERYLQRINK